MNAEYCPCCFKKLSGGDCPDCSKARHQSRPYHLPIGSTLKDRYRIGRVIGEGGFGITYIGFDTQLDMRVAIKEYYPLSLVQRASSQSLNVITPSDTERAESFEKGKSKFLEEARVMARLSKEHEMVRVQDFFEMNSTAYIVMEYIDGVTLGTLVKERGGRLEPDELFRIIKPLFAPMQKMHEMGLVHRDISPDNIMIENGEVKLLDFGCARESLDRDETYTVQLKQGFAPIEQYMQKGQGPWTDVYALCATVYFCLTGEKPPAALDRIMADGLVPPTELGANITKKQEKAILHGLVSQQNLRTQSIMKLYSELYGEDSETEEPKVGQTTDKRPLIAVAVAAVVLIAALMASAVFYRARSGARGIDIVIDERTEGIDESEYRLRTTLVVQDTVDWIWEDFNDPERNSYPDGEAHSYTWTRISQPLHSGAMKTFTSEYWNRFRDRVNFNLTFEVVPFLFEPDSAAPNWSFGKYCHVVFDYSGIVVKADGYDDVVIPDGSIDDYLHIRKKNDFYIGNSFTINLVYEITSALGIDYNTFASDYSTKIQSVACTVALHELEFLDEVSDDERSASWPDDGRTVEEGRFYMTGGDDSWNEQNLMDVIGEDFFGREDVASIEVFCPAFDFIAIVNKDESDPSVDYYDQVWRLRNFSYDIREYDICRIAINEPDIDGAQFLFYWRAVSPIEQ